jgi:hypothetical protein
LAKLWDFFDGEPFMENPHIAVFGNPRKAHKTKTKKGTKMAFKRSKSRNPKRHSRRSRARRNFPAAGLMFNPRRRTKSRAKRFSVSLNRRRRSYAHNPKRRHHRRRNPAIMGVALPPLTMIAWGAGGFIAPPMVEGFVNKFLPVSVTGSTLGRYAVKIGSVLALTYLTKMVLSNKEAFPVALGGSLYVVVSAVNEFAPQLTGATTTATAAYRGGMINAYRNGMIATGVPSGMGAYNKGVSGAIPGLAHSMPGLAYGPSALLPAANINFAGMTNPTFADPRFAGSLAR